MLVSQRGIDLGNIAPLAWNGAHVVFIHNYLISYVDMFCQAGDTTPCAALPFFSLQTQLDQCCAANRSNAQPTPNPVVSDPTAPSPPLALLADKSTCIHGVAPTKRFRKRVARM